jgi:hypothetical protein
VQCACGKQAEPGRDECFRCRVASIGFTWRGGALQGRAGFKAMTKGEYLKEHLRVDSEKELAKRTDVERAPT